MAKKKLSDDDVTAICRSQLANSLGFLNGKLAKARLKALQYYNAEPYGNEVEGSSAIVTTEVRDTVESMMPSLMKIFMSGDKVAQFDPTGPGDEEIAEQATDYANYIFTKDNPGFLILETAFRDGLIQKLGIVKLFWDAAEDITRETYQGLTDEEFQQLIAPDEVEPIQHTEYDGSCMVIDPQTGLETPQPCKLHDVVVKKKKKSGRVRIGNVPPEEFMISRRAVDLHTAPFVAHRLKKTASELIEMGFKENEVEGLGGEDSQTYNEEKVERYRAEDEAPSGGDNSVLDPAAREIWITECYIRMDYDGDGITELRKITLAGDPANKLLDNEEIDSLPFRYWTPVPQPHKIHGLSIADLTMDLQLTKSTVVRQLLDNMYRVNNGRAVVSGKVNIEDYLTPRPGGVVRMLNPADMPVGHVIPLETSSLGAFAFPLLQFLDDEKETRTGVTKYNQGLDSNSLNKTATGVNVISGYAQQRQELVARNAGELLVAGIFKSILELVCKHQSEPRIIQLRKKWVPMDPREWTDKMAVTVTVGLGTGNKDQQLQHLTMIGGLQKELMASGRPDLVAMVTTENIYNTLEKICENAGLKTADPYFTEPQQDGQASQPQQPPTDPKAIAAHATGQANMIKAQNEPQIEMAKAKTEADASITRAKIAALATVIAAMVKAGSATDQNIHSIAGDLFSDAIGAHVDMATAAMQPTPAQPQAGA